MRLSLFALFRLLCYTAFERFCRKCPALRAKRKGSLAMIKKRFIPFFLILMLLMPQALVNARVERGFDWKACPPLMVELAAVEMPSAGPDADRQRPCR